MGKFCGKSKFYRRENGEKKLEKGDENKKSTREKVKIGKRIKEKKIKKNGKLNHVRNNFGGRDKNLIEKIQVIEKYKRFKEIKQY